MKWEEEAHYIHTIQYFVALMRQHGVKQVLDDVKILDLDIFNNLCYTVLQAETKKKREAAIFKPFNPNDYVDDDDGRC
jgi:hypothetical protein